MNTLNFSLAKTLDKQYLQMDLEGKQQLISSMYPKNIVFKKENSRTNEMNYAIGLLRSTDVRFKKIKSGQEAKICNLSALVVASGMKSNDFYNGIVSAVLFFKELKTA
ncbi:MAG: hypothetical protein RJA07_1844 [Bacteroidota bacterium]|jgi:hypothetical protein